MAIIFNKKGLAFTFLAFFVVILLFAFAHFNFEYKIYSKKTDFIESRIIYLDDEINYFKDVYMPKIISYCGYNTIDALLNLSYLDSTFYNSYKDNYSKFNNLVLEGLVNGSFNGAKSNLLVNSNFNKTLNFFLDSYREDFVKNFNGNFSFYIKSLNVYEENPYYLNFQLLVVYNFSTFDNISVWNLEKNYVVSFPVYDLSNPDFLLKAHKNSPLKSSELNLPSFDWNLENFNLSLYNSYSTLFSSFKYDYLIGKSFLRRLFDENVGVFKDLVGFYNFDSNLKKNYKKDLSNNLDDFFYFGNHFLIYDFESLNIVGNLVLDLSSYKNNAVLNNVDCSYEGIFGNSCFFDGSSSFIEIDNNDFDLSSSSSLSFSFWFFANNFSDLNSNQFSYLFDSGSNSYEKIAIRFNSFKNLEFVLGNHSNGNFTVFKTNQEVSLNKWNHLVVSFDSLSGVCDIYLNGILVNNFIFEKEILNIFDNFVSSSTKIRIGDSVLGQNKFFGLIDEFSVFLNSLDSFDVADLYNNKKVDFIDLENSLYGKGVEFDGKDDFLKIKYDSILDLGNFITLESWVFLYENSLLDSGIVLKNSSSLSLVKYGIFLNNQSRFCAVLNGNSICSKKVDLNKWYYVVLTYDSSILKLYLNGILENQTVLNQNLQSDSNDLIVGKFDSFFKGLIDEIKIYNRVLSENFINKNYYNYAGFSKGCCNYLTLVNPNKFGFNTNFYDKEVSYSSDLFFGFYFDSKVYDVALWNLTNITSNNVNYDYFNFLVDDCVANAFQMFDYQNDSKVKLNSINLLSANHVYCDELVKEGFY